jgi:hypothetical protein
MNKIGVGNIKYDDKDKYFDCVDNKFLTKKKFQNQGFHFFLFPNKLYNHLETKKRYSCWIGGNSSAKSTSKARYFVSKLLIDKHCRVLVLRHNHSDIRTSVFLMLKGIIEKEGLSDYFTCYETTMSIFCKQTANMILTAGLDNTGKLSGIDDITDIWFEEPITRSNGRVEMITHEQFEDLDSRLRMPNAKLTMHLTLNPISKDFFVFKNILNPEIKKDDILYNIEDWDVCNSTYLDNPFLPPEAIKVIESFQGVRADYGKMGKWANEATGNEWLDFKKEKHVKKVPYVIGVEIHSTFDFNMLPYQTNLLGQMIRKSDGVLQVRIFKEYCLKPPLNTPENACRFAIEDFIEPYGFNIFSVYGDASGRYGYDNYRGILEVLSPYSHNNTDRVIKKNPSIRLMRDLINEILAGVYPDIELVIDEGCVNLILDMDTLQTAPDGFDNEKKNGVEQKGHCYSALVYLLCVLFDYLLKSNKGK